MKKICLMLFICVFCFLFLTCAARAVESETRPVLGTVCTIQLFERGSQERYNRLFNRLTEIENLMSVNIANSEISRINAQAGISAVTVSPDTLIVIQTALDNAAKTKGAFNPALGPLISLWAIGSDKPNLPSDDEIQAALSLCNWQDVKIIDNTVHLLKKGMALDLGGIAKGYAADVLADMLRSDGIKRAIIDLGGNIYALGEKQGGEAWRIGIKNPFNSAGSPVLRIDIKDSSLVTSGVYERFFERGGRRYHHILDEGTGFPAETGLMSVSIVAESSMIADVLSTAVFVMGAERGLSFLAENGRLGLCIGADKKIDAVKALKQHIAILSEDFSFKN